MNEKTAKIEGKKNKLAQSAQAAAKARLDAENKKSADRAAAISAKLAAASAEAPAPAAEATEGEAPAAEAAAE
jgi:small subunit ribosomal protein S16